MENNLDGNISNLTIKFEDGKIFHARYGKVNLSVDLLDYNFMGNLPSYSVTKTKIERELGYPITIIG